MAIQQESGVEMPEFVRNRMQMQGGYLDEIGQRFAGQVRVVLPLYDEKVRGISYLDRAAADLFA